MGKQISFKAVPKDCQRRSWGDIWWQTVPNAASGHQESETVDSRVSGSLAAWMTTTGVKMAKRHGRICVHIFLVHSYQPGKTLQTMTDTLATCTLDSVTGSADPDWRSHVKVLPASCRECRPHASLTPVLQSGTYRSLLQRCQKHRHNCSVISKIMWESYRKKTGLRYSQNTGVINLSTGSELKAN